MHTHGPQSRKPGGIQRNPRTPANHIRVEEEVRGVPCHFLADCCPAEIGTQESHQTENVARDWLDTIVSVGNTEDTRADRTGHSRLGA